MTRIIIKCMNEKCNNYKQELNEGTEICSLCNTPVTKIESKINPKLYKWALILSFAGFAITAGGGWIIGAIIPGMMGIYIMDILGMAGLIAVVVLGIMSKSKFAIILPAILMPTGILVTLWSYGIIEF